MRVTLDMSENQARIVSAACEFYARIRMGQFKEILWAATSELIASDDYCERMGQAEELLFEARKYIYPDLHGVGHSYGIGKFEDADTAYGVHMVLRKLFGDPRDTFTLSKEPLPTAEKREEDLA